MWPLRLVEFCFGGIIVIVTTFGLIQTGYATPSDTNDLILNCLTKQDALSKSKLTLRTKDNKVAEGYSGFIEVNETLGNNLFFWYFKSKNESAPTMLWINSGPGISSMITMDSQHHEIVETDIYTLDFSIVYVDSPVGTGYSYTSSKEEVGFRDNTDDCATDLYNFMTEFTRVFKPTESNILLHIAGQSYGGKFATALAGQMDKKNIPGVTLQGLILASPTIDPKTQGLGHSDYAFSMGIIGEGQKNGINRNIEQWFESGNGTWEDISSEVFYPYKFAGSLQNYASTSVKRIDYDKINVDMNSNKSLKYFHVYGKQKFSARNRAVRDRFINDIRSSTKHILASLLEKKSYTVLIYNGDFDPMINTNGIEAMISSMNWAGRDEYINAYRKVWTHWTNETLGYVSKTDGLCRVVIHGEGHNIGFTKPHIPKILFDWYFKNCSV